MRPCWHCLSAPTAFLTSQSTETQEQGWGGGGRSWGEQAQLFFNLTHGECGGDPPEVPLQLCWGQAEGPAQAVGFFSTETAQPYLATLFQNSNGAKKERCRSH